MPRRTRRVAYSTSTAEAKAKRAQRLYKHAHEVERIHKAAQAAKAAKAAKRDLEDPPYTKAGKRTKLRDLVGTQ